MSTGSQGRHLSRLVLFGTAALFLGLVARSPVRTFGDSGEYLARFTLDHWPRLYGPTPETFAERTAHRDWDGEPAIYAGGGRCRKALIQKRHGDYLVAACHQDPADLRALREAVAREGRGRDEWAYVNFE